MEITHGHPRDGVAIVPAQFNKTVVVNKTCHAVCCLSRNASYVAIPPGNDAVKTTSHESRLFTNHDSEALAAHTGLSKSVTCCCSAVCLRKSSGIELNPWLSIKQLEDVGCERTPNILQNVASFQCLEFSLQPHKLLRNP